MSRFYDAMRRAFEEGVEGQPETAVEQDPFDTTDPEIELRKLEAEVTDAREIHEQAEPRLVPVQVPQTEGLRVEPAAAKPTPVTPSYERIIQRLLAFRGGRRDCVVLVAGAASGEGASTVARDLAIAIGKSQAGRVVLVDANLRRPVQHDAFQIDASGGLAEVLKGQADLKALLRFVPTEGITVLCAGAIEDGAPQLITVAAVQKIITSLHSQFDWVILDGPAITTSPEATTLATVADGAILVVRAEQTRWEVAEEAKKILDQAGVNLLGGVLNRRKYHIPEFLYRRL